MEEEETEEGVGQEELVGEAEVEVERLNGAPTAYLLNLPEITIKICTIMTWKGFESQVCMMRFYSAHLNIASFRTNSLCDLGLLKRGSRMS